MSTTPLSECIENTPSPLPLADRLSSPSPSIHAPPTNEETSLVPVDTHPPSRAYTKPSQAEVDIGMLERDLATPAGFSMFDQTIPNYHNYGQKIEMPDSTSHWPHYIQFVVVLRYCRNVRPTWVKFDSKDTKESGSVVRGSEY